MTRVLQIRRGTTEENNNFTGLIGEITMDTDTKTLRLHDGKTAGGFAMARADNMATGTGTFDITKVPDDFWADLIQKHSAPGFTMHETDPIPVNSHVSRLIHTITNVGMPHIIQTVLRCQNADAGYNPNDQVCAFGVGNRCNPNPNWTLDENGLHLYFMVANEKYWVCHKETGIMTNITDENWRILFRVYC